MADKILDDHTTQTRRGDDAAVARPKNQTPVNVEYSNGIYRRATHVEDFSYKEPACDRYGWIG